MLGAVIGAGASILGGVLGSNSQEKAMKMQIAAQREFAQQGIRWKVDDAKAAGVHPVYALGAPTHSFSPIGLPGNDLGSGIANAGAMIGQGIDRAAEAKMTAGERIANVESTKLQLMNMGLQNELLASQIANTKQAGQPPALPGPSDRNIIAGQGDSARPPSTLVVDKPLERTIAAPHSSGSQEPAPVTDQGFLKTGPGTYFPVRTNDAAQRMDDDTIGNVLWSIRNRVAPAIAGSHFQPPFPAPSGKIWQFSPLSGYYLVRPDGTPEASLNHLK